MNKNVRYFNGNAVLAPDFETQKNNENEYEKLKKEKIEAKENIRRNSAKRKLSMINKITICFIMGIFLVHRYSVILNMQKSVNSMRNQISELSKENQNINVELAKYSSMSYVEYNAVNKLQMSKYNKNDAIYVDFSKKIINKPVQVKSSIDSKGSIITEISKFLSAWGLKIG